MGKIASYVILILISSFLFLSYITSHAFPNTYIASLNVSGKSKQNVENSLIDALRTPMKIRIKDRIYEYRYSDLGISLNMLSSLQTTFEQNSLPFPKNLISFFQSLHSNSLILPVLAFRQDYYHFINDSIYDFSTSADSVQVDNTAKRLIYQNNEQKYSIDPDSLKKQIVMNFGKKTIIEPKLVKIKNKSVEKVLGINTVLTDVFNSPIYITLSDIENSPRFTILPDQLKQLMTIQYDAENNQIMVDTVEDKLQTLMENIQSYLKLESDKKIHPGELKKDLIALINSRARGQTADTIAAQIGYTPNTKGNLAQKYIEVDISQQTMYLFKDGNLFNTYKISTGLYYPTPVGQFKILNKAVNAFSDIYHVWMPFWMAFYYGPEVDAYFGIHELPYWVAEDGAKIQRPREFIGSPHTGGCVALDVGAAKEVYAFSDVDMPVYVYN